MKTMSVGELKPKFSSVLSDIRNGDEIIVSYGRKKEKVAVIIPYKKYIKQTTKKLSDKKHGLADYANSWVDDPEFDKVIKEFDFVDAEMWK